MSQILASLGSLVILAGCTHDAGSQGRSGGSPAHESASGPPRLRFSEGDVRKYRLTQSTQYELTGEIVPNTVSLQIAVKAKQVHTVADIEGQRARIEVRYEDVQVQGSESDLARRLAEQTATVLSSPTGLAEVRHSEPGQGPGAPAKVAYLGAVLPDRELQPTDQWAAKVSFPIGRLIGRVVPEEHLVPVELRYEATRRQDLALELRYSGRAEFFYEHAAESAKGVLEVRGTTVLTTDCSQVESNSETASLEATLSLAGAKGRAKLVTTSSLTLERGRADTIEGEESRLSANRVPK